MNERQNINIIVFLPLFCAVAGTLLGVISYFYIYPATLHLAMALALGAGLLYFPLRHRHLQVAILVLFTALGLLAASARTAWVGTRILEEKYTDQRYWLTGQVSEISLKNKTTRLMLQHPKVYGIPPDETPQKVRISVQTVRVDNIKNGDTVSAEILLQRPNTAKFEGDFNYQRYAFYQGFGAVGQVRGDIYFSTPEHTEKPTLQSWRENLSARIFNSLGQTQGAAVLVALVTGQRDYVTEETNSNYQHSGLAHLMAISGFNLGAVGILLYLITRLFWAAIPPLAFRYNGKKPAAIVGVTAAFLYTLMAGMNIPVIRSFIMIAALFLAVWVERPRVALRLLGLAAILVAWAWPEGVLTASYQMSFAASLALILWSYWHDRRYRTEHKLMQGITYAKGVWVTSLLAGLATMPFVVWHFQNLTLVGFLANLVAVPLMGLLTTPLALAGFAAGIFVPWNIALQPTVITIDWVNSIAATMATWPLAQNFVPQEFTFAVLAIVMALLTLIYLRQWLWLAGAGTLAILLLVIFTRYDFTPDLVSLNKGEAVLIKTIKGEAYIARKPVEDDTKLLLKHYAEHRHWNITKQLPSTAVCDDESCLYTVKNKTILVMESGATPSADDCTHANLIVLEPNTTAPNCRSAWPTPGQVTEATF